MWVPEEQRTLYHAGLAHGANHLVTLVTQAMELLAAAGADDPAGTLRPLLDGRPRQRARARRRRADRPDRARRRRAPSAPTSPTSRANAPHTLPSYVALARATARPGVTDGRLLPIRAAKIRRRPRRRAGRRPRLTAGRGRLDRRDDRPSSRAPARSSPTLLAARPRAARRVGLVPTMGALHDGHAA